MTFYKYFNSRYGSCSHEWIQFCCQAIQSDNFQDSPRNFLLGSFLLSSLFPFLLSICQIWWLKDDFAQSDHYWVCSRKSKCSIDLFCRCQNTSFYLLAWHIQKELKLYIINFLKVRNCLCRQLLIASALIVVITYWVIAVYFRPSETPYTGGVFEFDIFFPPGYPRCPPKVRGVGVIYFLGQC